MAKKLELPINALTDGGLGGMDELLARLDEWDGTCISRLSFPIEGKGKAFKVSIVDDMYSEEEINE